jgi:hypothetical protein
MRSPKSRGHSSGRKQTGYIKGETLHGVLRILFGYLFLEQLIVRMAEENRD